MNPYDLAYEYVLKTRSSLFLTGKAGTGKTTFLKRLKTECLKPMVVVAPTGVAAINAEGVTIHSYFQLPPQIFLPTEAYRKALIREMRMDERKQKLFRSMELLVIDEVSMVRSDLLDTMDYVLRHFRRNYREPFGGVQVLMIGDLYQLSPVMNEQDWQLLRAYYNGPYFFQSLVFNEIHPVYIELNHVFRQQDEHFVNLLNEVRTNTLSESSRRLLNTRYQPDWKQREDEPFHITLSTHNHKVDALNEREMAKLDGPEYVYHAKIKGTFPETMYPMDDTLRLKVGARVMFLKNDTMPEKAYYNGKLGVVSHISDKHIVVESEEVGGKKERILVHEEQWVNTRYVTDDGGEITPEVAGSFTHIPLRPAWAVTIHKAQGLTFDHIVIDAEDAFAAGQVYVALSRCRTLEGLVLLSPVPSNALNSAQDVVRYVHQQADCQEAEQALPVAQEEYRRVLICSLYDFRESMREVEGLQRFVRESGVYDRDYTDPALRELYALISDMESIGEKFRQQLIRILYVGSVDEAYLKERLRAAAVYFDEKMTDAIHRVEQIPVVTEDKADDRKLEKRLQELQMRLYKMLHLMKALPEDPTVDGFFDALSRFCPPQNTVTTRAEEVRNAEMRESRHPQLLAGLKAMRTRIALQHGWIRQPHLVAGLKTLTLISNRLPMNKKDLLRVDGIGPKKFELFGEEVLRLVREYVENNKEDKLTL